MRKKRNGYFFNCNKYLNNTKIIATCLLLAFSATQLPAQSSAASPQASQQSKQISISGKVVDSSGETVIGASVGVKGTSNGSMTDLDGAFTINNVPSDGTLTISYLGYLTQEVKINGKQVFNIVLQQDEATALDEVVVEVGYGAVKRANLLGAVANMTTQEIKDIPTANLSESLYGRLAGVGVSVNNGTPGSTPTISIRKVSSYTSGAQQPLIVVDGIDRGYDQAYLNIIDPNDIESISVLKDASAAVYGARGAGGVILIKTKTGKEGKPKLSYSGIIGSADRTSFSELMSGEEHMRYLNDGIDTYYGRYKADNRGLTRDQFLNTLSAEQRGFYYNDIDFTEARRRNYNWLDKYWSSSTTTRHNINLSGGTKDISYFTSLSYFQQDGNIGNFNIEQYTFRVGVEAKLVAGLKGSFNLDTNTKTKKVPFNREDTSDGTMKNTFQSLMRTPSWMPYMVDGKPVYFDSVRMPASGNDIAHAGAFGDSYSKSKTNNVSMNIAFNYDFSHIKALEGLTAKVSYARTESNDRGRNYRVPYNLYQLDKINGGRVPSTTDFFRNSDGSVFIKEIPNGNRFATSSSFSQSYQFNIGVNYARQFGKHNVHAMFNYEETQSKGDNFNMYKGGLEVYEWEKFEAFGGVLEGSNGYSLSSRRGYVGRLNYDYEGKYLLESAFRYEASNAFPSHSRWGFFPSGSFGWRISEEDWYKVSFMDNAKMRISLGLVGDDGAVPNQWTYRYGAKQTGYLGDKLLYGIEPSLLGLINPDLKWETTFFSNYGMDLRLFKDFDFGFDFWLKNTWDILEDSASGFPGTSGFAGSRLPKYNYGAMKAWGYEISLAYNGRINKDMTYRIGGNMSWSDNKIKKKIRSQGQIGTWNDPVGRRSDSGIEGLQCLGIIRTQEQLDAWLTKYPNYKIDGKSLELGMLYYKDKDGDQNITSADYERLEDFSSNPYSFGLNLGFNWKSLSFTAQFSGGFGGHALMNKNDYAFPTESMNGLKMWRNHWTPENPNASMPRASVKTSSEYSGSQDTFFPSTFWIKDGAEMRLRSATLSYTVPQTFSSRLGLSNVRAFVTGTNLFTLISPYNYKDPQLSYFDSYPIMRTISFGLNFSL